MEEEIAHIGMTIKDYSEEFMDFPLIPGGAIEYDGHGVHMRMGRINLDRDLHPAQESMIVEEIEDLKVILVIDAEHIFQIKLLVVEELHDAAKIIHRCGYADMIASFRIG